MQKRLHWFIIAIIALVIVVFQTPRPTWSMPSESEAQHGTMMAGGGDNSISGRIREDGQNLPNITVRLYTSSNPNTPIQSVTTGSDGMYIFTNLSNNIYIVRPESPAYDFDPTQRTVTIFFGDSNNQNFDAILREYDVDGAVIDNGNPLTDIVVRLYALPNTTTPIQTDVTDSQGNYLFPDVVPGNYRVVPQSTIYNFVPTFREFSIATQPITLDDFEGNIITYDASGRVNDNGNGMANVSITLATTANPETILATTTTNGNGDYQFQNVEPGNYRITPTLDEYLMVPDYRDIFINNQDVPNINFEANLNVFDASGRITDDGTPLSQVQVILSLQSDPDTPLAFAVTNANGEYLFARVDPGNYRVTPSRGGYRFTPTFRNFTIVNAPVTGLDFEADVLTYNASGRVEDNGVGLEGVIINLSLATNPNPIATTETDANGNFAFQSLSPNEYRVTPMLPPYGFEPPTLNFAVSGGDVPNLFFEANILYLYLPLTRRGASAPLPTPTPTATPVPCRLEQEPNALADADNNGDFEAGRCILGAIPTGDANDFFRIQFAGGTFNSTLSNIPAGTDYDLTLYRLNAGQPELVAISNNSGTFNENITRTDLAAGTYYLGVQRYTGNSPNQYRLIWTQTP